MGTRPLRHFYGDDAARLRVDRAVGPVLEPWRRHRARFLAALEGLDDQQWAAPSRCTAWSNRDVICHLVDVDAYWAFSLRSGLAGDAITFLHDFDPTDTPTALVDARAGQSPGEVLDAFRANGQTLLAVAEVLDDGDDDAGFLCESPLGHVSPRLMVAHALWDSWLHEHDVLLGLGLIGPPEADELAVVTWYSLLFGGSQGGLVGDTEPIGPSDAFEVELAFEDLPGTTWRLCVDDAVRVTTATRTPPPTGSALTFVEATTGRITPFPPPGVDPSGPLAAQFARAMQVL